MNRSGSRDYPHPGKQAQSRDPLVHPLHGQGQWTESDIQRWLLKRPRFHVHFTPTAASWLNLVERWFAVLTAQQIRRGGFRSTQEL